MKIKTLAIVGLGLGILLPAVAVAQSPSAPTPPTAEGRRAKAKFPMSGATFQNRVDQRLAKMRARLLRRLEKRQLSDAEKQQIVARFDSRAGIIKKAASEAAADGTVTRQEAKNVRQKARGMRKAKGPKGKKARRAKGKFPRKGAEFSRQVEQRLSKVRARLQRRLAKSSLPEAKKRAIMNDFGKSAAAVRARLLPTFQSRS